jgi:hypothetical protein
LEKEPIIIIKHTGTVTAFATIGTSVDTSTLSTNGTTSTSTVHTTSISTAYTVPATLLLLGSL